MATRYPRFIIAVDGQQVATAFNHDEAWMQAMGRWRPGCVVSCESTGVTIAHDEPGGPEAGAAPVEAGLE